MIPVSGRKYIIWHGNNGCTVDYSPMFTLAQSKMWHKLLQLETTCRLGSLHGSCIHYTVTQLVHLHNCYINPATLFASFCGWKSERFAGWLRESYYHSCSRNSLMTVITRWMHDIVGQAWANACAEYNVHAHDHCQNLTVIKGTHQCCFSLVLTFSRMI